MGGVGEVSMEEMDRWIIDGCVVKGIIVVFIPTNFNYANACKITEYHAFLHHSHLSPLSQ